MKIWLCICKSHRQLLNKRLRVYQDNLRVGVLYVMGGLRVRKSICSKCPHTQLRLPGLLLYQWSIYIGGLCLYIYIYIYMLSTPSQLQRMLKLLHKRQSEERKEVYTARPADIIPWEICELRVEITLLSLFQGKKSLSSLLSQPSLFY
jgi:hypothetical protein